MSIDSGMISCSGCDFEFSLHYRPVSCHYHLQNGEVVQLYSQIGWCYTCDGVRNLEMLPSMHDVHAQITSLLDEKSRMRPGVWDRIITGPKSQRRVEIDDEVRSLQAQVSAFEHRVSGPRCLDCGSTEISAGLANHEHSCGGRFSVNSHPDGIRFSFREKVIHLNAEGLLLDQNFQD